MPDEVEPDAPLPPAALTPASRTCPHCGVEATTENALCPACGAAYVAGPKVSPLWGCLSALGGVVAGLIVFGAVLMLVLALGNVSTVLISAIFTVADLAAIGLAAAVIYRARRNMTPASPFLIALSVTLAGMLSTCAILFLSMGNTNFH